MSIINIIKRSLDLIPAELNSILLDLRYDSSTISEYYRKQGAQIGKDCRIYSHSLGGHPYLVNIGNHVFISEGVIFHTHDGASWICRGEDPELDIFGKITIEDNCIIGANSQLLPNIRIGKNSIVGAGSVVISNVPPNSIAMGVPARILGSSIKFKEKCISIWKDQKFPHGLSKDPNNKDLKRYLLHHFNNQGE